MRFENLCENLNLERSDLNYFINLPVIALQIEQEIFKLIYIIL